MGVRSLSGWVRSTMRTSPVARASIRFASAVVGTGCSLVVSMAAEGLLEPVRADVGIDLGVDDHGAAGVVEPRPQELEVGDAAGCDALAARGAGEGGEVGVGELGQVDGVAHRAEVVDLGSV